MKRLLNGKAFFILVFFLYPFIIPGISQATDVTIEGRLYDQNTGASITGATITVQAWSGDPCGWRDWIGQAGSNSTDGSYSITLNDIPPGTELFVSTLNNNASNYVNEWWTGGTPDSSSFPCEDAVPLQVPSGAKTVSFTCDFHLDTGYTLSGTVTNEDHQAVSGVPIQAFRNRCWQKPLVNDAVTGSDGYYAFSGIPNGSYYVLAPESNTFEYYMQEWYDNIPKDNCNKAAPVVVENSNVQDIDFELQKGGTISGYVDYIDHNPLDGVQVVAIKVDDMDPNTGIKNYYECSDNTGHFQFVLPPGKYKIRAGGKEDCWNEYHYDPQYYRMGENTVCWSGATPISVEKEQETSGLLFTLHDATPYINPNLCGAEACWRNPSDSTIWLYTKFNFIDWNRHDPSEYTFTVKFPSQDIETYDLSKMYLSIDSGHPNEAGNYIFTFKTPDGRSSTLIDHVDLNQIPKPDATSFHVRFDPTDTYHLIPTISWDGVEGAKSYRVKIYDGNSSIYGSDWMQGTSYKVPAGILEKGTSYSYKVQASPEQLAYDAYENCEGERDNLSATSANFETLGATAANSPPAIDISTGGVYSYVSRGQRYVAFYAIVRDPNGAKLTADQGDISSVTVTGPPGSELDGTYSLVYFKFRFRQREVDYSRAFSVTTIPLGTYTFMVTDKDGNTVTASESISGNDIQSLPPVNYTSLNPLDGAILTPDTLTFSWNPVDGAALYSIRFYDIFGNKIGRFYSIGTTMHLGNHQDMFQENGIYRWRIIAYRENYLLPGVDVDNACSSARLFDEYSTFTFRRFAGDFDGNERVDKVDLATFSQSFGRSDCQLDNGPLCKGDFMADGDVDGKDLAIFASD